MAFGLAYLLFEVRVIACGLRNGEGVGAKLGVRFFSVTQELVVFVWAVVCIVLAISRILWSIWCGGRGIGRSERVNANSQAAFEAVHIGNDLVDVVSVGDVALILRVNHYACLTAVEVGIAFQPIVLCQVDRLRVRLAPTR